MVQNEVPVEDRHPSDHLELRKPAHALRNQELLGFLQVLGKKRPIVLIEEPREGIANTPSDADRPAHDLLLRGEKTHAMDEPRRCQPFLGANPQLLLGRKLTVHAGQPGQGVSQRRLKLRQLQTVVLEHLRALHRKQRQTLLE